jgi:cell division protein FtsZ
MTINLKKPNFNELKPRIVVFGVGGAGGNAVANMIKANLQGVDFVVANTDAQSLAQSPAEARIQMGASITEGLGAGSRPEIGCAAAEESLDEILEHLTGTHMVFITAGMGGGTGTGAAPVIARAAKEQGILTVGVVTKPFQFEGSRRMRIAEEGIREFQKYVDTLIIIPNQNLFRVANEKTTFADAFAMADDVLHSGVRGITDLMVMPGLINLDFADVRTVMNEMGKAMMGTGEAEGENRAIAAAEAAISNPLLDDVSMKGAQGVLINITGGMDLTLFEVDEAANRIRQEVDPDANIIVGSTFCDTLDGCMRVSVVATGIDADVALQPVAALQNRTRTAKVTVLQSVQAAPAPAAPKVAAQQSPENMGAGSLSSVMPQFASEMRSNLSPVSEGNAAQVSGARAAAVSAVETYQFSIPALENGRAGDLSYEDFEAEVIIPASQDPTNEARVIRKELDKAMITENMYGATARERTPRGGYAGTRTPKSIKKRPPSLFERMTGRVRPQEEEQRNAPHMKSPEPQASRSAIPVPNVANRAPTSAKPAAPPLSAEPADRLFSSLEDDQIEIPAFLRRQVN